MSGRTASDGKSCLNDTSYLIISGRRKIEFKAASPLSRPPSYSTISRRRSNIVAFDFDYDSNLIYFADASRKDIKALFLNGTGVQVVLKGMWS